MSTSVYVSTRTHSVTYVTDKLLTSLKTIVRESGLNPAHLTDQWAVLERGIKRWLETEDLEEVHLEVFDPETDRLAGRWDFEIFYSDSGNSEFYADTDAIYYHLR
jgi:hypothetical protein